MTTPLIILGILVIPFLTFSLIGRQKNKPDLARLGGVLGLSVSFAFFSAGHFFMTEPMVEMVPSFIPFRLELIYATGILELALAIALLFPKSRRMAGLLCIAVLIGFFPANIYSAINHAGMGGHQWGPEYLLIRAPLQAILIGWSYWFAAKKR